MYFHWSIKFYHAKGDSQLYYWYRCRNQHLNNQQSTNNLLLSMCLTNKWPPSGQKDATYRKSWKLSSCSSQHPSTVCMEHGVSIDTHPVPLIHLSRYCTVLSSTMNYLMRQFMVCYFAIFIPEGSMFTFILGERCPDLSVLLLHRSHFFFFLYLYCFFFC